MEDLM